MFGVPQSTLNKFWVRKATTPRRYRFTFYPEGFFKTLQRKAAKVLKETGTGPDWSSSLLQDFLTFSFLLSFLALCFKPTFGLALAAGESRFAQIYTSGEKFLTGILLGMSNNSGHNWFHLGDKHSNWRKYYFDLSLVGHQEWRVSRSITQSVSLIFPSNSVSVNRRGLYGSISKQSLQTVS